MNWKDIPWEPYGLRNSVGGIISRDSIFDMGNYILVEIESEFNDVWDVYLQPACPCSPRAYGHEDIPNHVNSVVVYCKGCGKENFRVTGLKTGEWTLEVPE